MRRLHIAVALMGLALPLVCQAANPAALLEQWQTLRDSDAPAPNFKDAARFLNEHAGWPDEKTIRIRAETAALGEQPEPALMKPFCAAFPPISGRGMFVCLRAQAGDPDMRRTWLHKGWIQGDFSEAEEQAILADYGSQLERGDHSARMERLLYEEKTAAAKRMLEHVPIAQRVPAKARIALIQKDRDASHILGALSRAEQHSHGILFAQAKNAMDADKMQALRHILAKVPASAPYPELWWPLRQAAIRDALADGQHGATLALAQAHGDLVGEALAEALWIKGWMQLEFHHEPRNAYKTFHTLYTQVASPVSRARAAYWAGRAAKKNGNRDIAQEWWEKAAANPTVFYGQLAHAQLHPDKPLSLPASPSFSTAQKKAFDREELVTVTRHLADAGELKLCERFLTQLANSSTDAARSAMVASLGREVVGMHAAVKMAKLALRKKTVMVEAGWPRISLPETLGVEPALALAITRQESEFNPRARSSADARGLMQLLPSTARHVARQRDWPYTDAMLDNPEDNIALGSSYLGQLIRGFDGSYVLGIASYNAGPGTIRGWLNRMGTPPKNLDGALNWIESIPYSETRNYVMRVLENTQMYRTLDEPATPVGILDDLAR